MHLHPPSPPLLPPSSSTAPPPSHIYTLSLHDALPICLMQLRPAIATPRAEHVARQAFAVHAHEHVLLSGHVAFNQCEMILTRSEEHTSELQSRLHLVCRLLLEKKKKEVITQA